jgi:ribosome-associated translation inhibitor RaiA
MQPYIDVKFHRQAQDLSLVSAVYRWVARLEAMHLPVRSAGIAIDAPNRRMTGVSVTLTLADGQIAVATTSHTDPYVAVSDAFRAIRRRLLGHDTITPMAS